MRYTKGSNASFNKSATMFANKTGVVCDFIHTSNNSSLRAESLPTYSVNPSYTYKNNSMHGYYFHVDGKPKILTISGKKLNKVIQDHAVMHKMGNRVCYTINLDDLHNGL